MQLERLQFLLAKSHEFLAASLSKGDKIRRECWDADASSADSARLTLVCRDIFLETDGYVGLRLLNSQVWLHPNQQSMGLIALSRPFPGFVSASRSGRRPFVCPERSSKFIVNPLHNALMCVGDGNHKAVGHCLSSLRCVGFSSVDNYRPFTVKESCQICHFVDIHSESVSTRRWVCN